MTTTIPKNIDKLLENLTKDDNTLICQGLMFALDNDIYTGDLTDVSHFFDARALSCPMPLLKAKITLREVNTGKALYLLASDKNSQTDLTAYCQKNGLGVTTWAYGQNAIYHFIITKSN